MDSHADSDCWRSWIARGGWVQFEVINYDNYSSSERKSV